MLQPARDRTSVEEKVFAEKSGDPLRRWSRHSFESWQGQLNGASNKDVFQRELEVGSAIHSRVSREQAVRCIGLYRSSLRSLIERIHARGSSLSDETAKSYQDRNSNRSRVLFAPTARMVDYHVGGEALTLLASSLLKRADAGLFIQAIASGPSSGEIAWERPGDQVELVASLVRVAVLGEGIKKRIRVGDELRGWIKHTLEGERVSLNPRLGGVSAVGTVTARSLGHIPTMMALGGIPSDVGELLGENTHVVGSHYAHETLQSLPVDSRGVGNFSFLIPQGFQALGKLLRGLTCGAVVIKEDNLAAVDCLVTGSMAVPGFKGLAPERVAQLGARHDGVVLTGMQNLDSIAAIDDYCSAVQRLRLRGPLLALLYSQSKYPEFELEALLRLRLDRCIDFFGLNAVEAGQLVEKIRQDSASENTLCLSPGEINVLEKNARDASDSDQWGKACQDPATIVRNALALHTALRIPMVRVRGNSLDLAVLDGAGFAPDDMAEIACNLTASRLLGNIKTALPNGLINSPAEITQLFNFPEGRCLAALCMADDFIRQEHSGLRPIRGSLVDSFYVKLPDARYVLAVPPLTFFDRSGGTVSAGDIKDVSFFLESIPLLRRGLRGW